MAVLGAFLVVPGPLTNRLRYAAFTGVGIGAGLLLRLAIADLIARRRPPAADWAADASGYAFPSGHTATATIAAALLAGLTIQQRRLRRPSRILIWVIATTVAVVAGLTRIYLGVHWPTDVIGGWTLGVAWTAICLLLPNSGDKMTG